MEKNAIQQNASNIDSFSKYAQVFSIVTTKYDATLIFYQIEPQKVGEEGHQFNATQKEVARITIPLIAATELKESLNGLLK